MPATTDRLIALPNWQVAVAWTLSKALPQVSICYTDLAASKGMGLAALRWVRPFTIFCLCTLGVLAMLLMADIATRLAGPSAARHFQGSDVFWLPWLHSRLSQSTSSGQPQQSMEVFLQVCYIPASLQTCNELLLNVQPGCVARQHHSAGQGDLIRNFNPAPGAHCCKVS